MSEKHSCIQGDAFSYDFSSSIVGELDANWTGKWALVTALGEPATKEGTLALSGDNLSLELRILPASLETVPLGSYILVVEISNDTIGYRREVMQDRFTVRAQGIPAV